MQGDERSNKVLNSTYGRIQNNEQCRQVLYGVN